MKLPTQSPTLKLGIRTPFPTQAGFTMIELLVATVIMIAMVGGGIAAFVSFNDRQTLITAGKEVQTYIRSAQVKARSGDRPAECDRLQGYVIRATSGTSQVRLLALCEETTAPVPVPPPGGACANTGGATYECLRNTYDLSPDVQLFGSVNMTFGVLHGGVTNSGNIVLMRGTQTYTLPVSAGGEIGEGVLQ